MAAAPESAELRLLTGRATWALAGREMRRVLGLWPQTVLPPVVTGAIFLYLVDATRQGHAGVHETSVLAALIAALAVAGAVFALAVALVSRGWRLKP